MIRLLLFLFSLAGGYLLLRGWPVSLGATMNAIVAVILLGCGLCAAYQRDSGKISSAVSRRSHSWLDWTVLLCGMLVLEAFFLLFFLHTPPLMQGLSAKITDAFVSETQAQRRTMEQVVRQPKQQAGNWLWTEQNIRPLPRRANLRPGNQPEVFIQLDDATQAPALLKQRAYVSAFALGTYQDAAWSLTPLDTTHAPIFPSRPGKLVGHSVFLPADPSGQTPLISLQGLIDCDQANTSYRGDGITLLPAEKGFNGYSYHANSRTLTIDELPDTARAPARTSVPPAWLSLTSDEKFSLSIRGLNAEAVTAGSLKSQLIQLRAFLRNECAYSLDICNVNNIDPLENFLFHEKRGHCEMFATAGALCARALGLPSRIAYGWAGGSYYDYSNLFVFRAREAHAWTEVLIDGVGWVVMDCTPSASIGASQSAPVGEKPLATDELGNQQDQSLLADESYRTALTYAACVVLALALLICIALLMKRQRHNSTGPSIFRQITAPRYQELLLRLCRRHGVVVAPGNTVRSLLPSLPFTPVFAEKLWRYHYATTYEKMPREPAVEESFVREMQTLLG
jgi:transglutaminase-like putative cysteine protease